ncbi:MAG: D-glycero-beta-D-manno-heptose-7-phosphate kinase [Deltaproteobacteria bacterium]|jgi:rfaE bifunctional protein kinase chain/domain|nr:D-glycero-beta-D-manno-heptose-7-phosphate kinase [Deltaproteobacteria bacterium]
MPRPDASAGVFAFPDPDILPALRGKRVLVIGDLMLDTYLAGDADRISPEAPVPVVRVENESHLLGGAGNVASNITALGGEATIIGITGQDIAADTLAALFANRNIHAAVTRTGRPTTVKTRILARRQQMLRLDRECADPLTPDERAMLIGNIRAEAARHQVIILSDYAKGLFDAAFMTDCNAVIRSLPHPPAVLVDPKPQHFALYGQSTLLTPNLKETGEGIHLPVRSREEILAAGRALLRNTGCRHLLCTLGPQGMALFLSADEVWHIPATALDVFDVTGAGDTVIATIGLATAAGLSLLDACILANCAAGVVVGKVGAATASPLELADALAGPHHAAPGRWA